MPMTAVKTGVSTKTKVVVGVGILSLAGLVAYGFVTLNQTSTVKTITPAPEYKPLFIVAKAADAPNNAKTITGAGVIVAKMAVSSEDVIKWGKPALISVTVRRSGTATASAFKNWKLCSATSNVCVSGAVSGSDITFSNLGSLLVRNNNSSLIKAAQAQDIMEKTLVVKVDIASGYKGTLALSIPSTSSISGFKLTEWSPSYTHLQKAGIVGPSELVNVSKIVGPSDVVNRLSEIVGPSDISLSEVVRNISEIVGPSDIVDPSDIVGPSDIVFGETSPQVGFSGGVSSLAIGSVYLP